MLPMAGIFYLNKKAVKTLVVSQLNRKFAAKTIIMKSYGRKIIDYIFKRWVECPAICYEPYSRNLKSTYDDFK